MIISMKNLERLSIAEMEEFLRGSRKLELAAECQEAIYRFLEGLLASQQYRKLTKRERGIVRRFGSQDHWIEPSASDAPGDALPGG